MSLHFLLDGYNIVKQMPSFNRGTLEAQRAAFLRWLDVHKPQGSHKLTVVFDGKEEFFGSASPARMKVVFSRGESADDVIKKMAEDSPCKSLIVVSDDKDIKLYVRALGASVLSVREFMAKVQKIKTASSGSYQKAQASVKHISLTEQARINQEFEKIWIKST